MKWSELRRIAEEKGWYLVRRGRHDVYKHKVLPGKLILERHDSQEVREGLYYKLKKLIGF